MGKVQTIFNYMMRSAKILSKQGEIEIHGNNYIYGKKVVVVESESLNMLLEAIIELEKENDDLKNKKFLTIERKEESKYKEVQSDSVDDSFYWPIGGIKA